MARSDLRDRIADAVLEKAASGDHLFLDKRPVSGYVSTGSYEIDAQIGRPGIPLGRITEIKGWSGSGKSMLCCSILAEAQKAGGVGVLLDTEMSYTEDWATRMGVNTSELLDVVEDLNVTSLESALSAIHAVLDAVEENEEKPIVMVVDSLSALPTDAETDSEYDDMQPATHAKIMSKAMRKLTIESAKKNVALVFVSQLRETVMRFGATTTTLGGHAIFFHAALSMELKKMEAIKKDDKIVGMKTRVEVKKNKLGGPPFSERKVSFYYDRGIDTTMSALQVAVDLGMVDYNRGWYTFRGEEESFREYQWPERVNDELLYEIRRLLFPNDVEDVIEISE